MRLLGFLYVVALIASHSWEAKAAGCFLTISSTGSLTSLDYPSPYIMKKCSKTITAPAGKKVVINLLELDTYKPGSSCSRKSDRIYVYDKPESSYILNRTWCGSTIPDDNTFTSTANGARVVIKTHRVSSDYVNTHAGFNMSVSFVDEDAALSCGKSKFPDAGNETFSTSHIMPDFDARPYEFPYHALLLKSNSTAAYCGGSILSKRWILTAAHCVQQNLSDPGSITVAVHVDDIDTKEGAQILTVAEIISHADYNQATFNNDIALIKLNEDIVYSNETQPVCLPEAGKDYIGRTVIAAGWGRAYYDGQASSSLRLGYMRFLATERCIFFLWFSGLDWWNVNDTTMICSDDIFGSSLQASCYGDDGGPVTVKENNETFHIVGINSWGYGCPHDTARISTRVTSYIDWIQDRII